MEDNPETKIYHNVALAMGAILLMLIGWIGLNVAHIPQIEQKLEDFIVSANKTFDNFEQRIRALELNQLKKNLY